jgi:hypothetical protein
MEILNGDNERKSSVNDTSSLRTQLMEAQILDCQLGGADIILDDLLAEGYSASTDDCNVSEFRTHYITYLVQKSEIILCTRSLGSRPREHIA